MINNRRRPNLSLWLAAVLCIGANSLAAGDQPGKPPKPEPGKPTEPKPPKPDKPAPTPSPTPSGEEENGTARVVWGIASAELSSGLQGTGSVKVPFKVTQDLTGVSPWLTPSLSRYIAIEWTAPAKLIAGTTYALTLKLRDVEVTHTLGGTLHLRQGSTEDGLRRTYPQPLTIKVKGTGPSSEDDEEGEAQVAAVAGAADFSTGGSAPGQIISVFGKGLGPKKLASLTLGANGRVSDYLADTQVLVNGTAAPMLATSESQVNTVVPFEVAGKSHVEVVVTYKGRVSNTVRVPVHAAAPAIFTMHGMGHGQAAVLNQDQTLNSADKPATIGSIITFYGTGVGLYKQSFTGGEVVGSVLPTPANPVTVTIGGVPGVVKYVGGAPGMVSAVVQFNVQIAPGTPTGPAVPVVVSVGGKTSKANVTVAVK